MAALVLKTREQFDLEVAASGRPVGLQPSIRAIVGQDGIAMAAWECHDLTTLSLDTKGFVSAILGLIEGDTVDAREGLVVTITWTVRWGTTC